jgi:hypothetical protein
MLVASILSGGRRRLGCEPRQVERKAPTEVEGCVPIATLRYGGIPFECAQASFDSAPLALNPSSIVKEARRFAQDA